jgi:tRNA pseudouridine38-40 synthase
LLIAYDGTNYVGWQRQLNGVSVQQLIEEALVPFAGREPGPVVVGASRTDAGVHAHGQVASVNVPFAHDTTSIRRGLNIRLPADVRVLEVTDAAPGFHARSHSTGKSYRYRMATLPIVSPFERWFVWHAPGRRDVAAMQRAADVLTGRHDFASFQAGGASVLGTVRTIERLEIVQTPGELVFEVEGDGFLRHMVRAVVGTLAEIGLGSRPADAMPGILAARSRPAAGATAPASGLTLREVRF